MFTKDRQMAAACFVHPREAADSLGLQLQDLPGGEYSRGALRTFFTFTPEEFHAYVLEAPMRANEIWDRALGYAPLPSPYMLEVDGGFHVGIVHARIEPIEGELYSGRVVSEPRHKKVRFHEHIDEAATDFVLTYWGLPRPFGTPIVVTDVRRELAGFAGTQRPPLLQRIWDFIRSLGDGI